MLKVDNSAVRRRQIEKLQRLRAERDEADVQLKLNALTNGAAGGANLLELAVEAARAKATVGEISDAWKRCSTATRPRSARSRASICARPARTT